MGVTKSQQEHERMEYLRKMEKQLFPKDPKPPKHHKNRLKAYKKVRDSAQSSNPGHNFTGSKIKVNQNSYGNFLEVWVQTKLVKQSRKILVYPNSMKHNQMLLH